MAADLPPKMTDASKLSARFIAARDGHLTYEGKACPRCSSIVRYVSTSNCCACQRKTAQQSRLRAKEAKGRALREAPVMMPPSTTGENNGS